MRVNEQKTVNELKRGPSWDGRTLRWNMSRRVRWRKIRLRTLRRGRTLRGQRHNTGRRLGKVKKELCQSFLLTLGGYHQIIGDA